MAKRRASSSGTTVQDYMTRAPRTIRPGQTLAEAHRLMRKHHIRHLPVLARGKLVGIVSQRDLMLIETLPDVSPGEVPVEDAMIREVFVVARGAPLGGVASRMAARKLGAAIVVQNGRVVGIFTVTDACRALADVVGHPALKRRPLAGTGAW